MFRKFFILNKKSVKYRYVFPSDYLIKEVIEEPFLFPCDDIQKYEHGVFVVVLTEINGDQNFLITTYIDDSSACVCFQSDHAWFELIYAAMAVVIRHHLYLPKKKSSLEDYLNSLMVLPSPVPGLVLYVPGADPLDGATKVVVPTKSRQRPFSIFVSELRSRLQFEDWLIIFESLLFEKWIIFHSCYLDRISSCIFASLSLLFPLEWVHLIFPCLYEGSINCLGCPSPYIAGIHSCLLNRVIPLLSSGAVIVDIDQGTLNFVSCDADSSSSLDDFRLPKSLANFLWRSWSSCDMKVVASMRRAPVIKGSEENVVSEMVNGFRHVIAFLLGRCMKCRIWDPKTERFTIDKASLTLSRGEQFQEFIGRLLESQMVHQFIDDRLNLPRRSERGDRLMISLSEVDDFEESCVAMDKWQPDIYTDTIATFASKSKRKINVLANKMLDIAKKTEVVTAVNDRVPVSASQSPVAMDTHNGPKYSSLSVTKEPSSPSPPKTTDLPPWVQFGGEGEAGPLATDLRAETDLLTFCDWDGPAPPSASVPSQGLASLIRDFDPLYRP